MGASPQDALAGLAILPGPVTGLRHMVRAGGGGAGRGGGWRVRRPITGGRRWLMAPVIDHVADGVWLVTSTDVNWVLVAGADGVTLVDAGFPRDLPRVLSSLQQIGRAL